MFFLLLILVSIYACGNEKSDTSLKELYFDIDESLLSAPIIDDTLGIEFRVPKYVHDLDPDIRKQLAANLGSQELPGLGIIIEPRQIFMDSTQKFILMINRIASVQDTMHSDAIESAYKNYLSKQLGDKIVRKGSFSKQGIPVTQFVIQDGTSTIMKIFFSNDHRSLVQFDYLILADYDQRIKAIEASIGSINQLKQGGN